MFVWRAGLRGDVIRQAVVGLVLGLLHLLAQEMERGQHAGPGFIGVELDIVADGVGREEAVDGARGQKFLGDDFVQQRLGIVEELLRLRVFQDGGIAAAQFPGVEERRPVDEGHEVGEGDGRLIRAPGMRWSEDEHAEADELRFGHVQPAASRIGVRRWRASSRDSSGLAFWSAWWVRSLL